MGIINEYIEKLIRKNIKKENNDMPWLQLYENINEKLDYYSGSIYDKIKESSNIYSNLTAYEFFKRKCTYKEFILKIEKCARSLKKMGIKENECVTICMPNIPEAIFLVYAVNSIGAICNMVHPLSPLNDIMYAIDATNSSTIFVTDITYKKVANIQIENLIVCEISNELDSLKKMVYNFKNKKNMQYQANVITWPNFLNLGKDVNDFYVKRKQDDPAVIIYSGGTTGKNKGIILSNLNFNSLARQSSEIESLVKPGNSVLSALPIFHGFGLAVCVHMALANGMMCILVPKLNTKIINLELIKYRPNLLPVVPSLLELICNSITPSKKAFKDIKGIFCGGDFLSIELKKQTEKYFLEHGSKAKVRIGYGLSEATAYVTATYHHVEYLSKSIGIPNPDNIVKIVYPNTTISCPFNEVGEICVCGPTVMLGYINNDSETEKVLITHEDGRRYLHTGDLGYMDEKGIIYYTSRLKRMIISSGYNIYPLELEEIICKHPDVKDCVVVGIEDKIKKQVPKAVIVLKEGIEDNYSEMKKILDYCKENMAAYEVPKKIEFKKDIPKTAIGKVAYRDV